MDIKLGQSRGILEKEKGKKSWYHQLSILKYLVWLFFFFSLFNGLWRDLTLHYYSKLINYIFTNYG